MKSSTFSRPLIGPLLTDKYQLTMAYGYWRCGRHLISSVFEVFFRKNPFAGQYTVFAGIDEVVEFLRHFKFSSNDVSFIRSELGFACCPEFYDWLESIDASEVKCHAMRQGEICFPQEPLLRVEGPIAICQLLETTILNLVNFPSLIATNAARMRYVADTMSVKRRSSVQLLEFGLRRAQGPNGALTASKYSYVGGFDGTSNVLASKLFGIPCKGTHAHAFVVGFMSTEDIDSFSILPVRDVLTQERTGEVADFSELCHSWRNRLGNNLFHEGELAAFIAYALSFPEQFLALVDTYDSRTGIDNFLTVAFALLECGYHPVGIRLDSGDLSCLSLLARLKFFNSYRSLRRGDFLPFNWHDSLLIVASNDVNEKLLHHLERQGHEVDTFGIGTNLVTCQAQPALGCVYKLVQLDGHPRIKLSDDFAKITFPGKKNLYRIKDCTGLPVTDILLSATCPAPVIGEKMCNFHPFRGKMKEQVIPASVDNLLELVFDGGEMKDIHRRSLTEDRNYVMHNLKVMSSELFSSSNPKAYKLAVSEKLFNYIRDLRHDEGKN